MPSILLPIMTGLFLVCAGILIGYFLWFRDRTEEEALQQKLTSENNQLTNDLSAMQLRSADLDEQLSKQNGKLQILQELCDDLVSGREQTHQQRMEMEAEMRASRQLLDESREKLNEENKRRTVLEDQLHEFKQHHLQSVGSIEGSWREKHAKVESTLVHRESEVQKLTAANERTAEKLHQAEARIAEFESELETQRGLLQTATTNANGLEREYTSLESSLRSHIEQLNESRGQAAAALSAKETAEESLRDLREQFDSQQQQLKELEQIAAQAEQTNQKCIALQQSLDNNKERLMEIAAERETAIAAENDALTVVAGLRKQNENQEMTIRDLRSEHSVVQNRLKQEATSRTVLESEFNEYRSNRARKEEQLTVRVAQLEEALDETENDLTNTEKDLSETEERLIEFEQRYNELESHWGEHKSRLEHVVQQRDNSMTENNQLRDELDRLRAHSKSNEETIRNLRRERGAILLRNRQAAAEYPRIISGVFNSEKQSAQSGDAEYGGTTRRDPLRGVVYTEAPQQTDDLKLISGVAEVLERRLNDYGIYTYRQVMEWDTTAIEEFSKLLAFKDRIERDDWVGQATRLYDWKYVRRAA